MKDNNKILLVDDEPDLTLAFKLGLEDNGFQVDTFNDPLMALLAFKHKSSSYALVLLDIKMPKMDGFELYNEMRQINDQVRVCFITAYQQEDINAISLSDEDIIRKPITIKEMVQKIKNHLT
jgi:Response regulator containing CheY-like receiver, AAA-type ATPase, and DNA-binding domains